MRDEAEFVEFAQHARTRLRRTAYLLCGDWDQAADHVQEGLIRLYVAWPRMHRAGREYAYASKAVVSAFLDHARRRSSRELPSDLATLGVAERTSSAGLADAVTTRETLMRALADLPPRQRACVVLRYFEDLSVAETAAVLECSEGTVKSQTSRGLDSLRAMFEGSPFGELVTEGVD